METQELIIVEVFCQEYQIERGQHLYKTAVEITIPTDIDPGDYHLMISLTDHVGWNSLKGISIKIQ